MINKVNILGINVLNGDKKVVIDKIYKYLADGKKHYIVTPNPEIILEATGHDEELFYIINSADIALPDGIGLKFAAWLNGKNISRVTGADLLPEVLALASERKFKVAIINRSPALSSNNDILKTLNREYPGLAVLVEEVKREEADLAEETSEIFKKIRQFKPDLVFATLGAPWQEKIIYHLLFGRRPRDNSGAGSIKIALAVGGAFDFITGKIKRAPAPMRLLGLEWLWRLTMEPWRLKRIYRAIAVFPYKFLVWRFILPAMFRKNVVCLLYKRESGEIKILIVERGEAPGHWQLPQGGTDGEDLTAAGSRELREEINCRDFKPRAAFADLNTYEFGRCLGKFGVPAIKARGYKGQKQGLFIAEFYGRDQAIKVNFWEHRAWKWVSADDLVKLVYPSRQEAAKIFLEKFREMIKR